MVLRVLNQILEVPELGNTPKAHWGPIWLHLAKIWPNKIDFGNPQEFMNMWGVTFGGFLSKNIEF